MGMKRNSFSMSGDYYVDIDIDYDEALEATPEEYIRDWLGEQARVEANDGGYDLSDPVVRLGVITQLRAEGYVVEPA
jgi:hypothetical protein